MHIQARTPAVAGASSRQKRRICVHRPAIPHCRKWNPHIP